MRFISFFVKLAVSFALFIVLGQIPFAGINLEYRTHDFVNTEKFQNTFWSIARPVTWTYDKASALVKKEKEKAAHAR